MYSCIPHINWNERRCCLLTLIDRFLSGSIKAEILTLKARRATYNFVSHSSAVQTKPLHRKKRIPWESLNLIKMVGNSLLSFFFIFSLHFSTVKSRRKKICFLIHNQPLLNIFIAWLFPTHVSINVYSQMWTE